MTELTLLRLFSTDLTTLPSNGMKDCQKRYARAMGTGKSYHGIHGIDGNERN